MQCRRADPKRVRVAPPLTTAKQESWPWWCGNRRAGRLTNLTTPRPRSRALIWPTPASTPSKNCWRGESTGPSESYRCRIPRTQDLRSQGVAPGLRCSRIQRPQARPVTHWKEHSQAKLFGPKGRLCHTQRHTTASTEGGFCFLSLICIFSFKFLILLIFVFFCGGGC